MSLDSQWNPRVHLGGGQRILRILRMAALTIDSSMQSIRDVVRPFLGATRPTSFATLDAHAAFVRA